MGVATVMFSQVQKQAHAVAIVATFVVSDAWGSACTWARRQLVAVILLTSAWWMVMVMVVVRLEHAAQ